MKKNIFILAVIFCLLSSQGCVPLIIGAAAGVGGVSYAKGKLEHNVDHSVKKVHKATVKAFKKLKLYIKKEEVNKHNVVIKAEFEDGKKLRVDIEALTERASKIKIRVGMFEDEKKLNMVWSAIKKKL